MVNPTLTLVIQKGPKKGENLECSPGRETRIGRVIRGNTFTIKDPSISQKHLTISAGADGCWRVSDLGTSNGTFVNDSQISPLVPTVLRDGDILKIGTDTSISVRISGSTGVKDAVMEEEEEEEEKKVEVRATTRRYATRRAAHGLPGSATTVVEESDGVPKKKVARTGRVGRPPRKAVNIVVTAPEELLEIEKLKVDNGDQEYVVAEEKCEEEGVLLEENAMQVDDVSKTKVARTGRVRQLPRKAANTIVAAPEELLEIEKLKVDNRDEEYVAAEEKCEEEGVLLEENAMEVDDVSKAKVARTGQVRQLPRNAANTIVAAPEELLEIEKLKVDNRDEEYVAAEEKCEEEGVLLEEDAMEVDDVSKAKVARTGQVRQLPRKAANTIVAAPEELLEIEKLKVDNREEEDIAAEEMCEEEGVLLEENVMEVNDVSKAKVARTGRVRQLPRKASNTIVAAPEELLEIEKLKVDNRDQKYVATEEKCEEGVLLEQNTMEVDKSDKDMGAASTSGLNFGSLTHEEMESMTLREWFDRMEKYMPMIINDIAEEIIADLREKAKHFDELASISSNDTRGKS